MFVALRGLIRTWFYVEDFTFPEIDIFSVLVMQKMVQQARTQN